MEKWLYENIPELIYVLLPPNNLAKRCAKYKIKHYKVKLIFDIIDLWPESMPISRLKLTYLAKKWADLRNKSLNFADCIFIECNLYKKTLEKYIEDKLKLHTLYLYKSQTEKEKCLVDKIMSNHVKVQENFIRIAYVGSINNIIDIEKIKEVFSVLKCQNKNLQINIIGDGEKRKEFVSTLEKIGCEVNYFGKVFDEIEKIKILGGCDYALNIMKNDVNVGLTIKSIDYFSYGLPIINNIKGDTWKFVEDYNIGVNVSDDIIDLKIDQNEIMKSNVLKLYHEKFSEEAFITKVIKYLGVKGNEYV